MASYEFPASDRDQPDRLLGMLGGFWADIYLDAGSVRSVLTARAAIEDHNAALAEDLAACVSRFTTPVLRRHEWHRLVLLQSGRGQRATPYGGNSTYVTSGLDYGTPTGQLRWDLPAGLVAAALACDRTADSAVVWVQGVDYTIENGEIVFRADPFEAGFAVDEADDPAVVIWLYSAEFDEATVANQYGYAIGLELPSTDSARDAVNAVYDCLVEGTTPRNITALAAAATDSPIAATDGEVVDRIVGNARGLWVITDRAAYRGGVRARAIVAERQILSAGQPLFDAFTLGSFSRGQLPAGLTAVALSRGLLQGAYFGAIVFRDETVPLVVEEDVLGATKVSFQVHGFPGDIEKFWADVHRRGIADGRTLANLLDQRPTPSGEPTAAALPTTINPLKFLAENIFRNNVGVLTLKPRSFGLQSVPQALRALAKVVPSGSALIVSVELRHTDAPITLDGPGTADRPGYSEAVTPFQSVRVSETLGPDMIRERIRVKPIGGACV